MTRIKLKTDLFRREVTLENAVSGSSRWRMTCVGFLAISYDAATAGEAVEMAFKRFTSMSKDMDYKAKKKPVKEQEPTAIIPAEPIKPLNTVTRGKKIEQPLSPATV